MDQWITPVERLINNQLSKMITVERPFSPKDTRRVDGIENRIPKFQKCGDLSEIQNEVIGGACRGLTPAGPTLDKTKMTLNQFLQRRAREAVVEMLRGVGGSRPNSISGRYQINLNQ